MMNWCLHTLQTNSKVTCDGIGIGYLTPYVDWYIVRMKFCQVQFEPKLVSLRSVEYCNFTPDFSNYYRFSKPNFRFALKNRDSTIFFSFLFRLTNFHVDSVTPYPL